MMPEHEDFYTPSRIDEQVDDLLLGRASPAQDRRMADDLLTILEHEGENAHSLQKVLDKLLANSDAQPTGKIIPIPDRQQQGGPTVMQTHLRPSQSRKTQSMFGVWSTLAAVLIVAVLVGSMVLILNTIHQQPGHPGGHGGSAVTPTTPTATPTASSIVVSVGQVASHQAVGSKLIVLTTVNGFTLYVHEWQGASGFTCDGSCTSTWKPLVYRGTGTPASTTPLPGKLSIGTDAQGRRVVFYQGYPLYTYVGDTKPGDFNAPSADNSPWQPAVSGIPTGL